MIDKIFICTSKDQALPAKISKYSFERSLSSNIEIEIVHNESIPYLSRIFNKNYIRGGKVELFDPNDMQSFTLARFFIPELMEFKGTALVIDPDIFLAKPQDFETHSSFDFNSTAIFCRRNLKSNFWASSSMFIDCSQLGHWQLEKIIKDLMDMKLDYNNLINLAVEPSKICEISNIWNDFDNLDESTILLHLTQKSTQPWRAGLPLNSFIPPIFGFIPRAPIYRLFGKNLKIGSDHPNDKISNLFFNLFKDCIENKTISANELDNAISNGYLREDIKEIVLPKSIQ